MASFIPPGIVLVICLVQTRERTLADALVLDTFLQENSIHTKVSNLLQYGFDSVTMYSSGKKWEKVERRSNPAFAIKGKVERMFLGQYDHTIDEKGRMTIPVRYRDLLQDGAFVTIGFDRNLMVLTAGSFDKVREQLSLMSLTDNTARQLRRLMFANADRVEVDRAGRVLIPQYLRDAVGLQGAAILVGVGDYFEIWAPEHWNTQNEQLSDTDANAQRFAALDISLR